MIIANLHTLVCGIDMNYLSWISCGNCLIPSRVSLIDKWKDYFSSIAFALFRIRITVLSIHPGISWMALISLKFGGL